MSIQPPLPASSVSNPTAVAEAIEATLLQDEATDGAATISASCADRATIAMASAADRIHAIDLPPWIKGVLPASPGDACVDDGLAPATRAIPTGPGLVDAVNVDVTRAGGSVGCR